MTDLNLLQTLVIGHLWQSVALAALLAAVLIIGARMRGATRYSLSGAAFLAAIALPLAAFIPGESLMRMALIQLDAPKSAIATQADPRLPSVLTMAGKDNSWAMSVASSAIHAAREGSVPLSQTKFGQSVIEEGAPPAAIDFLGNIALAALEPKSEAVAIAPPAPLFRLPEISLPDLPDLNLPDLNLPDLNLPDLTVPLALIWLAGTMILLVRTGRDLIAVERLVARARPINLPEALARRMGAVRVATSTDAPGPMAAGLFRPCIVLPESIALGSPGMAALLEHERAHIERCDMLVALLQRLTLALLWWSPALHWISRRIDEEREVACDEAAVRRTGDAQAFARSLTKQAENQLWARAPRLAVGAIGPKSQVGRRVRRLIDSAKGASASQYSGRLAFAGLALAVAVAAMVTPRFNADAQQAPAAPPPVDNSLDGSLTELLQQAQRGGLPQPAQIPPRPEGLDGGPDHEFAGLSEEIATLMQEVAKELQGAFAGLSPELEAELQGLSGEMAALGVEISAAVAQDMAQQMPRILEEVRAALEAEGVNIDDWSDIEELSGLGREDLREALQEAREEIREELGPEMREEIRAAIEEARSELASHRGEIRAAIEQSRAGSEIAKAALARARAEIEAARARGEFGKAHNFDFDIDLDEATLEKLRDLDINIKNSGLIRIKGVGEFASSSWRLMTAAQRGDTQAVRALMRDKANVNAQFDGEGTPLIAAAKRGRIEVVRMLLEAGADANLASPGDGNPLIAAAANGHEGVAKLLIERGANPNAYVEGDETPLINAAAEGELGMAQLLVENGAKVNLAFSVASWPDGRSHAELRSPLGMAQKYGRNDVASYLRSKGALSKPQPAN